MKTFYATAFTQVRLCTRTIHVASNPDWNFVRLNTPMHPMTPGLGLGGSVVCAGRLETRRSGVQPPPRSATFFRGDWSWNIFYGHSLPLPLIQEGQLSVSGERMCTILVNRLEDYAYPVNVWLGKLTALDMTPLGWLGRKPQHKQRHPA